MTNDLGRHLASMWGGEFTLGASRRGNRVTWVPGATIDVWVPCARGEVSTGVTGPHVYFVQTIGGGTVEDGSIHCPTCRADLAARRTRGTAAPPLQAPPSAPQSELPF